MRDFAQMIRNATINQTLLSRISNKKTHASRHIEISDAASLDRAMNNTLANSRFLSQKQADELTEYTLFVNAKTIDNWLNTDTGDPYETKEFLQIIEPEQGPVGSGMIWDPDRNAIREYYTDTIRVVLQKNPTRSMGFTLLTAYPDMSSPNIQPTGRNLAKTVTMETETYQKADPAGKTYQLYRTDSRNNLYTYYQKGQTPEQSVICVRVPTNNPNVKHNIYLSETESTLMTTERQPDGNYLPIRTKYTDMRDAMHPNKTFRNYKVQFRKDVQSAFYQDYPAATKQIAAIKHAIRDNIPEERKPEWLKVKPKRDFVPTPTEPERKPATPDFSL